MKEDELVDLDCPSFVDLIMPANLASPDETAGEK